MANFSLQILLPIASGTSPDVGKTAISANHRIFWAYPGIQYSIRAGVTGGLWPYTFSLSGAPSGMTINSSTGVITWTASSNGTSSGTITLSVTDSENTTVTSTWAISVDSSRFVFFDADAVSDGTGTLASPYNTTTHLKDGSIANTKIMYFRGATNVYRFNGIAEDNVGSLGFFRYISLPANTYATQFLAYPGESPVFDMGKAQEPVIASNINTTNNTFTIGRYGDIWATGDPVQVRARRWTTGGGVDTTGTLPTPLAVDTTYYVIRVDATTIKLATSLANAQAGTAIDITDTGGTADTYTSIGLPGFRFTGGHAFFDGITFQNCPNNTLRFVNDGEYIVFWRCMFDTMYGGGDSMNAGFIMTQGNSLSEAEPSNEYTLLQNTTFNNWVDGAAVKYYKMYKPIIEDCTFSNGAGGTSGQEGVGVCEGLAIKGGLLQRVTVRWNVFHDIENEALDGNNHILSDAEYYHNLIYSCPTKGFYMNNFGTITTPIYIFRNTFLCDVWIRDGVDEVITGLTDADAGPFNFTNNVIVNNDYTGTALSSITYDGGERGGNIVMTTNLQGVSADNITTSVGALTGTYRDNYLGLRGYEVGVAAAPTQRIRRVRFF